MTTELPVPFTRTDELLVAVHEKLGEILDRLPPRQDSATAGVGTVKVDISEPARESVTTSGGQEVAAHSEPPATTDAPPGPPPRKAAAKKTAAGKRP